MAATALERKILERIEAEGAMTFHDFMQAALYDEEFGYYNTERLKIGAAGDYYTSSNVHPAFGAILARAFVELWRGLADKGEPLTLVEMGAGTGQLASDVLTALRDEHRAMFDSVRYVIVEQSRVMRERQREKLREFAERLEWRKLPELEREPLAGIFFSNELLDAMPVHRVRISTGAIEELYVVTASEGAEQRELAKAKYLTLAWQAPSTPLLESYIERANVRFAEGQVIEINLEAIDWLWWMARAVKTGFLVTIDYGDEAAHLYSPERRDGSLRCFYRHTLNDSPLERVGEQDITASVNFSALMDYGREFGFEVVSYERQTNFLFRSGLIERIAAMESDGRIASLKDRLAVKNLLAPGGVSDNFRVLIQKKL